MYDCHLLVAPVWPFLFPSIHNFRLKATFEQCDVDGDGTLTCEEIRKSLENLLSSDDLEDLMSDLYRDGNNEVDCNTFVQAMKARIDNNESVPVLDETLRYI